MPSLYYIIDWIQITLFGLFAIPQAYALRGRNQTNSENVSTATWLLMAIYTVIRIVDAVQYVVRSSPSVEGYLLLFLTMTTFFSSVFILWRKYQNRDTTQTQLGANLI